MRVFLQSTYKKIGAFLLSMAKDENAIKVNERSKGVFEIVDVDRKCALYRKFKAPEEEGEAGGVALPPVAEVLYSVPKRMKNLFQDEEELKSNLMTKTEARNLLLTRVKERGLMMQDKQGWARMDEDLQAALKVFAMFV